MLARIKLSTDPLIDGNVWLVLLQPWYTKKSSSARRLQQTDENDKPSYRFLTPGNCAGLDEIPFHIWPDETKSPLMTLPVGLRIEIYRHILPKPPKEISLIGRREDLLFSGDEYQVRLAGRMYSQLRRILVYEYCDNAGVRFANGQDYAAAIDTDLSLVCKMIRAEIRDIDPSFTLVLRSRNLDQYLQSYVHLVPYIVDPNFPPFHGAITTPSG